MQWLQGVLIRTEEASEGSVSGSFCNNPSGRSMTSGTRELIGRLNQSIVSAHANTLTARAASPSEILVASIEGCCYRRRGSLTWTEDHGRGRRGRCCGRAWRGRNGGRCWPIFSPTRPTLGVCRCGRRICSSCTRSARKRLHARRRQGLRHEGVCACMGRALHPSLPTNYRGNRPFSSASAPPNRPVCRAVGGGGSSGNLAQCRAHALHHHRAPRAIRSLQ